MIEHFDSARHSLDDYAFDSPIFDGFEVLDSVSGSEPGARIVEARYLIGGTPSMADTRRFRMTPDDLVLTIGNAMKRLEKGGFIPALFEHGWSFKYGGAAGGRAVAVFERDGDLWVRWHLNELGWSAGADPKQMTFFGRSAGFRGWRDEEGFIRPADFLEGSFTNFPAMNGLGSVIPMQELAHRYATRINPAIPSAVSGAGSSAPGVAAQTFTSSHSIASSPKETEPMPFPTALLQSLGLAETATEEDVIRASQEMAERAGRASAPPAQPPASAPRDTSEVIDLKEELRQLFAQKVKEYGDEIRAERAKADRERAISEAMRAADEAGKINKDNEAFWREVATGSLDTFRVLIAQAPVLRPTSRIVQRGTFHQLPQHADGSFKANFSTPEEYCQVVADATVAFGCSISDAIRAVDAGAMSQKEI